MSISNMRIRLIPPGCIILYVAQPLELTGAHSTFRGKSEPDYGISDSYRDPT